MKKFAMLPALLCWLFLSFASLAVAQTGSQDSPSLNELVKQEEEVRLARKSLVDAERAYGVNHVKVAEELEKIAKVYEKQRKYTAAEHFFRRALKIRETELGENHFEVATTPRIFGELHFKHALVIEANTHGPDSLKLVAPLIRLAELQESQRQFAIAIQLHERALTIREKALGPDHRDLDGSLMQLAHLHHAGAGPKRRGTNPGG